LIYFGQRWPCEIDFLWLLQIYALIYFTGLALWSIAHRLSGAVRIVTPQGWPGIERNTGVTCAGPVE
jgi:hypothetical protein